MKKYDEVIHNEAKKCYDRLMQGSRITTSGDVIELISFVYSNTEDEIRSDISKALNDLRC